MLHDENDIHSIFKTKEIRFKIDTSEVGNELLSKIARVRGSLLLDQPFFGYILGHYTLISVIDSGLQSFAVDDNYLYFNSIYIKRLIEEFPNWKGKLKGILMHLVLHLIYKHLWRMGNRNTRLWAKSSDIVVFLTLNEIKSNFQSSNDWEIPEIEDYPDDLFEKNTETIYNLLLKQITQPEIPEKRDSLNAQNKDSTTGLMGRQEDNRDIGGEIGKIITENQIYQYFNTHFSNQENFCDLETIIESEQNEEKENRADKSLREELFDGIMRSAYSLNRSRGFIPNNIVEIIDNLIKPKINWRIILSNYVQKVIPYDFSWTNPNKKVLHYGYYLPSNAKESISIMVALDTSGSIDFSELKQYLSEIQFIIESIANSTIIVVDCDSEIQQIEIYQSGEDVVNHTPKGRGGTDFRPVFDKLIKNNPYNVQLLIYLTDGDGEYPKSNFNTLLPVIWVLSKKNITPPFGKFVYI